MASQRFAVRSVAIIGAGSSGLAAARYFAGQGVYERIVVYERRPEVGGIWNHTFQATPQNPVPQVSPYFPPDAPVQVHPGKGSDGPATPEFPTAMYDSLYVNIPHPLMGYTDMPIADFYKAAHPGKPLLIYPTRQTIQEYLVSCSQGVRHLIRFGTNVDDIRLLQQPSQENDGTAVDSWEIHTTDTGDNSTSVETFDAVIVAHGHYETTFVPAIAKIDEFHKAHPGVISHSKRYRNTEQFKGKRVIVVGNSASGLDIASQINEVSERPIFLSVHTPTAEEALARFTEVEEVPEIKEFLIEERGVRLADGRVVRDVDAVVFCTGFLFSLPFLEKEKPAEGKKTPEGLSPMLTTGRRIHRLYDDMVHIDHPTLAFLSLPIKVIPYPLAQAQSAILARVWANTLALPSKEEMEAWEREAEKVRGPAFHVWESGEDGSYINATYKRIMEGDNAASRAGKEPPRWDGRLLWMRKITPMGKGKFEDMGRTATTLEELGFVYDPTAADASADSKQEHSGATP
ncbi:thiol-specific monooxygenase [Ophiostoma piceae UAMH 11346]|uniref:Thiol-specific monooxygenase n=1 Tax=Ophiostoma piceae (strain UAMH 11346) TaxID=1262450 RepID=S3BWZ3_OPHP1|nr:thiol-specific monooxygenase [Ophiostoma piceae UAMH 11346]